MTLAFTETDDDITDDGRHPLFADAPSSVSFNKLRKRLLRQVRQAMDDFAMLKGQKRWLIGLSGGKDSYGLLALLMDLQWRGLLPVELIVRGSGEIPATTANPSTPSVSF